MSLIILVGLIFLIVSQVRLQNRMAVLEERLLKQNQISVEKKETKVEFSPIPQPAPKKQEYPSYENPAFTPTIISQIPKRDVTDAAEFFLYTWFKEHTLIKIGGVFFFLGALWFVSYAINVGWLVPEIRIALGFALALLSYVLGFTRSKSNPSQYVVLTALGTGIVCATVSAAQMVFSLFNPVFALTLLGAGIGYTLFVARQTQISWLTLAAAAAGLLAPLMVGGVVLPLWILLYLFVLSAALLLMGFLEDTRGVTLLMVTGVFLYEVYLLPVAAPHLLWLFVCLFSLLFFAGITHALVRFSKPQVVDVLSLFVASVGFVYFASEIALSPSLATFMATLLIAATGYALGYRNSDSSIVVVYALFALAGLLTATSFLFSGFTLVLAYIIEITAAFFTVTYLGLARKVVTGIALAYVIPLLGSLESFASAVWQTGIWHMDALVVYSMWLALGASTMWLLHKGTVVAHAWSRPLAAVFGSATFVFGYGVAAVVCDSVFMSHESTVITYVLWSIISLTFILYTLKQKLPLSVLYATTLSLGLPLLSSLPSFTSRSWEHGINHVDSFGVWSVFIVLCLTTLLITQRFCKEYEATVRQVLATMVIVTIGYLFVIFSVLWHGLLDIYGLANVAIYMSYAVTLYALTSIFVLLRAGVAWIGSTLAAFALPVVLSLSSFNFSGWQDGAWGPNAVGLYGLTTLLLMIALGLRNKYTAANTVDQERVKQWSKVFFVLTFLYSVGIVWVLSHSVVLAEQAVSLALFVYTISGLWSYQYGKRNDKRDFTYAGTALLGLVVMRLILVDVWQMELLARIITFLGIGFLFMATALLERLPSKQ